MKQLLTVIFLLSMITSTNAQEFGSMAGQEEAFNKKYKLSASIDEQTMMLKWSTDAPIIKAVLSVYTKEQLAVRKGTDHVYPFTSPVNSYQFNLNAPAYKGFHAYWLKVYSSDSLWQEYYFQKKSTAPPTGKKEEIKLDNLEGYTIIKTNTSCEAGKQKLIAALKEMEGVTDVKIDIKTGKLALQYSSDGTPYTTILATINEHGFDADGQKTTHAANNARIKKRTN